MAETFGSTCHGAGRARSRNNARTKLEYQQVLDALKAKGISIRWVLGGTGCRVLEVLGVGWLLYQQVLDALTAKASPPGGWYHYLVRPAWC